ncbi:hypothetical protein PG987_005769 [Apiospora arundinis]
MPACTSGLWHQCLLTFTSPVQFLFPLKLRQYFGKLCKTIELQRHIVAANGSSAHRDFILIP